MRIIQSPIDQVTIKKIYIKATFLVQFSEGENLCNEIFPRIIIF